MPEADITNSSVQKAASEKGVKHFTRRVGEKFGINRKNNDSPRDVLERFAGTQETENSPMKSATLEEIKKVAEANLLAELSDPDLLYGIGANIKALERYKETGQDESSETAFLIRLEEEARRRGLNPADEIVKSTPKGAAPIKFESERIVPKSPTGLENLSTEEINRRMANLDKSGLDQQTIDFLKRSMEKELTVRKSKTE